MPLFPAPVEQSKSKGTLVLDMICGWIGCVFTKLVTFGRVDLGSKSSLAWWIGLLVLVVFSLTLAAFLS
jgi:hypothetical protein